MPCAIIPACAADTAYLGESRIIEEHFDTADWQGDWNPRYNIAPTQPVPIIRQHPNDHAVSSR